MMEKCDDLVDSCEKSISAVLGCLSGSSARGVGGVGGNRPGGSGGAIRGPSASKVAVSAAIGKSAKRARVGPPTSGLASAGSPIVSAALEVSSSGSSGSSSSGISRVGTMGVQQQVDRQAPPAVIMKSSKSNPR